MKKLFYLLAGPVILTPLAYLWTKWPEVPTRVPVHYGLDGMADRIGSKSEFLTMVLVLTGVNVFVLFFLPHIYKIDPRKTAADNKSRLNGITFATVILLSLITFVMVDNAGAHKLDFQFKWLIALLGAFWCVLGNYMYNIKPNYFAGLRLPWTLNNEDNWRLTHRLAGKVWFAGGLLVILLSFLLPGPVVPIMFIAIVFITILIPAVYSYRLYLNSGK